MTSFAMLCACAASLAATLPDEQGGAEKVGSGFRKDIRARLAAIQRENGTWRGDHCITSTTFCTAASLITLAIEPYAGRRAS